MPLRLKQRQLADASGLIASLSNPIARVRIGRGVAAGLEGLRVVVNSSKRVGHFSKSLEHSLPVHAVRFLVGCLGLPLLRAQRASVIDRLRERRRHIPDVAARNKTGPSAAAAPRQHNLRIEVGRGHADVGAGLMQQSLRSPNIGPLPHQRRR